MKQSKIATLYKTPPKDGEKIKICGWAKTTRDSKNIGFIELTDGTCFKSMQIVFESEKINNYKEIAKCGVGTSFEINGTVVHTPNAKQPFEINADEIEIIGECGADYPLQKKRHTLEFLRTMPHLRMRTNTLNAAMRVRSTAAFAIHKFFNERGFVYAHTPIITGSDCEGAGEMFRVSTLSPTAPELTENGEVDYTKDFFKKQTNLTVSGQLEAEAFSIAFSNAYTFGPTFRAENSNTPRHAAEFWMIEPEIAFADLNDDMDLAEDMMKSVVSYIMQNCPDEIDFFTNFFDKTLKQRLEELVNSDFVRITYTKAIEILEKHNEEFQFKAVWGVALQTEHERFLTEKVYKKPVFVTDYPKDVKSFYMRLNDDGKTVAATDMLVPGVGELIGGSQREERLDVLISRINEMNLSISDYEWYLDLRRYGTFKHAGFGLGFERLVMYVTGIANIRDVIAFPRTPDGF